MAYLQAAGYVNHFDYPFGYMWRQENPVSYHTEKDGETKFWDGGQCEVVGEGTYHGDPEEDTYHKGEGQGWGVMRSGSNSPRLEREADEHDPQLALALSEEDPHVDEDLSKSVSDLSSVHEEDPQMDDELAKDHNDLNSTSEGDHHMDEELAKRLRGLNLHPVPHVPRVNTGIPTAEASSDKQRLLDRLTYYGLAERKMAGDGNCQFRALSDQLYRTPDHHMSVRMQVVSQLAEAPDSYSSYVPMEYNQYLENMARNGEWGDHVTLQAAADSFGVKICLITSFKASCFIEIIPSQQKWQRGLYLSFWSEIHYNSICPLEENDEYTKNKEWPFSSDLNKYLNPVLYKQRLSSSNSYEPEVQSPQWIY